MVTVYVRLVGAVTIAVFHLIQIRSLLSARVNVMMAVVSFHIIRHMVAALLMTVVVR